MLYHPYEYRKPPSHKPKPAPCCTPRQENVLLPKIVACERRTIPCLCTELTLEDLPCCAVPPFQLLKVRQSGAQPWWRPVDRPGEYQRMHMKICIPVCAEVKDSCGKCYHASGVVEAEVFVKNVCSPCDTWHQQVFIFPCVMLLPGCECSESCTFCVKLEIQLEIYLLRPEPCAVKKADRPEKPCPDLPMYPQPCHDCRPHQDDGCHWRPWVN